MEGISDRIRLPNLWSLLILAAILVLVLVAGFLVLVANDLVVKLGFGLWILTFAFGWRTLYLTPYLNIHPSEVLIILLFFLLFARAVVQRARIDFSIPIPIVVFMVLGMLGVVTALFRGTTPDVILEEFKCFLALIPTYYVVKWLVKTRGDWERALFLGILVAAYLGVLGLMDYFTPNVSRALAGSAATPPVFVDLDYGAGQFARVGFIFYGNYSAGFVIFTFLGVTIYQLLTRLGRNWVKAILLLALLSFQLAGVYLSGYRGLWYSMGFFLAGFALLQKRAWLMVGATLITLPFLPTDFYYRFESIFNTTYADSSQYARIQRIVDALELIKQSPLFGVGWGGSGYVHSDLTQIAANLGLPALAVFVVWLAGLGWEILRITRHEGWIGGYAGAIFATLCGLAVIFASEGLIAFVQLLVPVWFLLAMSYKLVELSRAQGSPPSEAVAG